MADISGYLDVEDAAGYRDPTHVCVCSYHVMIHSPLSYAQSAATLS